MKSNIFLRTWFKIKRIARPAYVFLKFKTLHGPSTLNISNDQFVVVCMVKDGEYFIETFIQYYLKFGAKHIVFIDNGSTDKTISIAKNSVNITVLQCMLPAKHFENDMRRYASFKFCKGGGWCLFADMDEFIDFPGNGKINMSHLLKYLNSNNYTAVVGQMVDMYPMTRISDNDGNSGLKNFMDLHKYYETENIKFVDYHGADNPNEYFNRTSSVPTKSIQYAYGGVRYRVFGSNNLLTKHPLVRIVSGVTPSVHPSCSSGVVCADFELILKHYKFAGDFAARVSKEVKSKTWDHGETESYLKKLEKESPVLYVEGMSKLYSDASDLVDGTFIYASKRYLDYTETKNIQIPLVQ